MKVCLIYPPEYNTLWMPYSSLPALAGYLRAAEVESFQHDWNIEIHEQLLERDQLLKIWNNTSWGEDYEAPYPGVPKRSELVARLRTRVDEVCDGISDAVALFRDPSRFYDVEEYTRSQLILNDALLLLACASWNLETILATPAEALKAAMDPKINIYLPYIEKRIESLLSEEPDMVGLSVTLPRQFVPALAVARLIKDKKPGIHVTLGGAYVTMVANAVENSPELFDVLDSVVLSEGEVAVLGLARTLRDGGNIGEVPGILYREGGAVRRTSLPVMVDADELPSPDFDGLPLEKYFSPEVVLPAFSSRGCYWRRCTFCARPDRRGFSQRSPGQVIKDLVSCMKKYKTRMFHFTDNAIRPRRMAAIADAVVESGHEINWTARTRFSPDITMEWCDRVAAGGLVRIIFGVETASKRVLELMQKGFRVEDVPKTLQALSKAGIDSTIYLMVGFPTETKEEAAKTIAFIEKMKDSITHYSQFYISPFGIPFSSPIHKEPEKFQVTEIPEPPPNSLRNPYCFDFHASEGMTREEMAGLYVEFREKISEIAGPHIPMPHDMLMRKMGSLEQKAAPKEKPVLKMTSIPRLADDLRAERGYLKKGDKKIRIDENLGALIELLDSKKPVKAVVNQLAKIKTMSMANAFIYLQQLLEEGVINIKDPKQ